MDFNNNNNNSIIDLLRLLSSYAHAISDENAKQALYLAEYKNNERRLARRVKFYRKYQFSKDFHMPWLQEEYAKTREQLTLSLGGEMEP